MKNIQHHRKAYTFVELLVVVSIVAVLISLILPSLDKARQVARQTVCSSNMRNMYQATAMYQSDFKLFYPIWAQAKTGNAYQYGWDMILASYLNGPNVYPNPGPFSAADRVAVYQCPDGKSPRADAFNRVAQDYAMPVVGPYDWQAFGLRVDTTGTLTNGNNQAVPSYISPGRTLAQGDNFDVPGTLYLTEYQYNNFNNGQGTGNNLQRPYIQMLQSDPLNFTPQIHGGQLACNNLFADGHLLFANYLDTRLVGNGSDMFPLGAWTVVPKD